MHPHQDLLDAVALEVVGHALCLVDEEGALALGRQVWRHRLEARPEVTEDLQSVDVVLLLLVIIFGKKSKRVHK